MEYKRPGWYQDNNGNRRWWNGVSWSEPSTPPPARPPVQSQDQYVNQYRQQYDQQYRQQQTPPQQQTSPDPVENITKILAGKSKNPTSLARSIRRTIFWVFGLLAATIAIPIIIAIVTLFAGGHSNSEPADALNSIVANQDCETLKNNMSENMLYMAIGSDNCKSFSPEQANKFTEFVKFYDPSSSTASISYMKTSEAATITVTPQDSPEAAASFHFTKQRNGLSKSWVLNYISYENFDKSWYSGDPGQAPPSVTDCIASADYSRLIATDALTRAAAEGGVSAYCKYDVEYDSDFADGLQPITVTFDDLDPGETEPTSAKVAIIIGENQKTITSWTYFYDGEWG